MADTTFQPKNEIPGQGGLQPATPPDPIQLIASNSQQYPEQAKEEIVEVAHTHLRRMLNFRQQYDSKRSGLYKRYIGIQDGKTFPDKITPRSNIFVPYPLSNVETLVSRTMDALFAFDPWFESKPRGSNDAHAAEAMGIVLKEKLEKANFLKSAEELIRNICIYGHGAIKVDWDWEYDVITTVQPEYAMVADPNTGEMVPLPGADGQPIAIAYHPVTVPVKRSRPKFTALDIFDFVVDPDGGMVAQMTEKTLGQMKRESQMNPVLYYPEALQELEANIIASGEKDSDNVLIRMAELWDEGANTCTLLVTGIDATAITWKDMRYATRSGAAYRSWKRKVYGGKPVLLWHGENPFMHKKAPIIYTSYIKLPNEIYGLGAIEVIQDMSDAMNRMVNMISDNWNMGINRRYAYDTQAEIDHDALNNMNVPGGKVGVVGDPNKVIKELPFMTPTPGDYELLGVYKNMIELTSGISDFYAKGIGQSSNDTATGISQIIGESSFRFKLFISNMNNDILMPLLQICASLVQQFLTDEEEVLITDEQAMVPKFFHVQPAELIGSVSFDLVGAQYATNKMAKQRNVLAFAQLAGQMAPEYIDPYKALIELGKLFEIPNIKEVLKTPEQVAFEQQQAQKQQMEMLMFETALQTESAARIAQSKPKPAGAGQGSGGGRPHALGSSGRTKGAGLTTAIRSMAQNFGLRGMGLEGLGESGNLK